MQEGYTFGKKSTVVYEWEINRITTLMEKKKNEKSVILKSSEFSIQAKIKNKWQIRLYLFNGVEYSNKQKDFLGLFICNLENHCVTASTSLFMLNSKREKLFKKNFTTITFNANEMKGYNKFVEKETLLSSNVEMIPNDTLTICLEVTVTDEKTKIPLKSSSFVSAKSLMSSDYKDLYNSRAFSDTTVVVEDKKLQVHKIILIARSPVLAAMFTHDMDEKKTNQIFITDITPNIFEKLLEFIYTDEVSDLDVVAADLLEAADKYQIISLKKLCEESLCKTLKPENSIRRLDLAARHNAQNLMEYVIQCITADALNIIETEDFKKYEKSNPSLGFKLFKTLAAANISNKLNEKEDV